MTKRAATACLLCVGALLLGFASPASAKPSVAGFSVKQSDTRAGGHPDLITELRIDNPAEPEVVRDITFSLPAGVFGNPGAIHKCRAADFAFNHCQPGAQAGLVTIFANFEGEPQYNLGTAPIYNVETVSEDETARLAFVAPTVNIPIVLTVAVRSRTDYGLDVSASSISQTVALSSFELIVWGLPADPEHDAERFRPGDPGEPPGCPGEPDTSCNTQPFPTAGKVTEPFTDNPSVCTGEDLPVVAELTSYQDPGNTTSAESAYPATTGCESQRFDPVFNLDLTTSETDSPSGLDIQLKARQFLEGESPSPSTLRSAALTLPEGLTINPDAADGQSACPDALAGFGTDNPGACPDSSKIGTMEVGTPALEEPLVGSLYIGEPRPGDQYRLFMIFDGQGIHAKLFASIKPNPATGQLTISLVDIPQVPFEEFNLHLFASDRGLMATPLFCTIYRASAQMVPWNDVLSPQTSDPMFGLTTGPRATTCPGVTRPFRPHLAAGTSHPLAGDFSSFTLQLDRDDGDQFLGDLTFRMPPGFTGDLRGIPYCPDASVLAAAQNQGRDEQAAPTCPPASQIGTTNVAAGPGEHPFHAVGRMYLSGPFKGAPLSLAAITPALAGPYDYGTVVVRVALHVDPRTAQVFAASDTVPSIIGGVPIRMRSIRVNIDRPNFTINPTNCSPFTVDSQGIGDQGTVTDFSSYFQAVNCGDLPFRPKMRLRQLGKRGQTKRAKNPRLEFDLWTRSGDANLKRVAVTLPKAFAIDQRHLGNICAKAQLEAELCSGRQPIGHAWVKTPLLDEPLAGPAYAVSGFGKLPRVAFILNGQVTIIPQAESTSVRNGHLKTVVPVIPDAPVGHFRLTLLGGNKGYLVNTRDLCVSKAITEVRYVGQNGRRRSQRVRVKTPCGEGRKAKRSRHGRR
jgi:hypothetical protein